MEHTETELDVALRAFVADHDVDCPSCSYNLRGLAGTSCPECGLELRLMVQLSEPSLAALMISLAALFGLGGAGGFVVVGFVFLSVFYGDWAPLALWVVPVTALAVGAGGGLWLGSRSGRVWFRKQPPEGRQGVAIGSWVIAGLSFVAFMVVAINY